MRYIALLAGFLTIFLLNGCKVYERNDVVGLYENKSSYLKLYNDGTFKGAFVGEFMPLKEFNGVFVIRNKYIYLIAYEDVNGKKHEVILRPQSECDNMCIRITSETDEQVIGAHCSYYKNDRLINAVVSDSSGSCKIDAGNSGNLRVEFPGYESVSIDLDSIESSSFEVHLVEEDYVEMLNNKRFKIQKYRLVEDNIWNSVFKKIE
jgi:hypothetical protein